MNAQTWRAAFARGRELGIYGDFLFSEATQGERGMLATVQGPVFGLFEEALGLTQGNVIQAMQGKDPRFGAELVRAGKGNLPFQNLWYAKAALDHLIFMQLQEYFSPGYMNRIKRRSRRQFAQQWWWEPGEALPERGPDFERLVGE